MWFHEEFMSLMVLWRFNHVLLVSWRFDHVLNGFMKI